MSYAVERRRSRFYGVRRLQHVHARRSLNAQRIDEGLRAPRAKTAEQWLVHPNRYDIPNVDTPKHA